MCVGEGSRTATDKVTAGKSLGKYRWGARVARTAAARQTRLDRRGYGQEEYQYQCGKKQIA
jgi:hypothetical protein